jgi:hypothetical protein
MDPVGLGLENFDGIGQFRTMENDVTIDANADLDGEAFAGAAELGVLIKEHPSVPSCLVRNLFRHATGHIEGPGEAVEIEEIEVAFADAGYQMQNLLVELVASPAFRLVGNPE